tara:strand:+ start:3161 stop:4144 length:984 start_codon:yes stop_codon:yes gene_type:complete
MSIILHDFDKEEWQDIRTRYSLGAFIGGSEAPAINGTSSYGGGYSLMRRKLGLEEYPDLSGKINVQRGNTLEPIFLDEASQMLGVGITKPNYMLLNKEHPFMIANFDGVTDQAEPYIIEVKTTQSKPKIDLAKKGIVPDDWLTQGDHYLHFTQFKGCPNEGEYFKGIIYVIAYHIHHEPILIEVTREERLQHMERLLIKEKAFIDMFNDKIVPEPTGLDDDTKSIKKQYPTYGPDEREATQEEIEMRNRYKELSKTETDAKKEKAKISNILKDRMGVGNYRKIQSVCFISHGESFDKKALVEKLKKHELDHLVDESKSPYSKFSIMS